MKGQHGRSVVEPTCNMRFHACQFFGHVDALLGLFKTSGKGSRAFAGTGFGGLNA